MGCCMMALPVELWIEGGTAHVYIRDLWFFELGEEIFLTGEDRRILSSVSSGYRQ